MSATKSGPVAVLYYATRDGQARRITEYIQRRLAEKSITTSLQNAAITPAPTVLAAAGALVLVAAVRYGHHLPEAESFLRIYQSLTSPPPLVLASVNLTARKPAKTTAVSNNYLRKTIAHHRLDPAIATAFAGRLDYSRYRWLDRHIIRFIMLLTQGPTKLDTCIEYTSWSAVDVFAAQIADLIQRVPAIEPAKGCDLSGVKDGSPVEGRKRLSDSQACSEQLPTAG